MERKITALKAQKRNPNRVNVYLDGDFAFGLARVVAAWLSVGQSLSEEKIAKLQHQEMQEKAYQTGLRLLARRLRSETEVSQKLTEKGFDQTVITGTLSRLRDEGLLQDVRFARSWAESRVIFRPRSKQVIRRELRQKGVAEEVIQETLEGISTDEESLAYAAGARYSRRLAGTEWMKFRQRLSAFLGRRGFGYETVLPVVRRIWEEMKASGIAESNQNEEFK
jgi:regulatory protein